MTAREALLAWGVSADSGHMVRILGVTRSGSERTSILTLTDRTAEGLGYCVQVFDITQLSAQEVTILKGGTLAEAEAHFEITQAERSILRMQTSCLRTSDPVRQHAMDLLLTPPVRWEVMAETSTANSSNWRDLVGALEGIAVGAARLSRYLGERCVGATHDEAVKRQNRLAKKIRRALGYNTTADLRF